ncbi:MAG: hypothetical protein G8D58_05935 [gamma proteobacterium symbiont of Phacoides pectinatus]
MSRGWYTTIAVLLASPVMMAGAADHYGYGAFRPLDEGQGGNVQSLPAPAYPAPGTPLQPPPAHWWAEGGQAGQLPYQPPAMGGYRFRELESAQPAPPPTVLPAPSPIQPTPWQGMTGWPPQPEAVPPQPVFRPLDKEKPKRKQAPSPRRPYSQRMLPGPQYPFSWPAAPRL